MYVKVYKQNPKDLSAPPISFASFTSPFRPGFQNSTRYTPASRNSRNSPDVINLNFSTRYKFGEMSAMASSLSSTSLTRKARSVGFAAGPEQSRREGPVPLIAPFLIATRASRNALKPFCANKTCPSNRNKTWGSPRQKANTWQKYHPPCPTRLGASANRGSPGQPHQRLRLRLPGPI
jgi:hypothetical protein